MSSHTISVIIPNYNHASFLKQRLDSVLNQTLKPFEIIVLDDCSTDNSVQIIEEYVEAHPQIKFIKNEKNSGSPFAQWNKAVSLASGDLVWIAESDDVAEFTFLETLGNAFEKDDKLVLAYSQSKSINEHGNIIGTWKTHTDDLNIDLFKKDFKCRGIDYIDQFLVYKNTIPNGSAVVFKKNSYIEVGCTSEPLPVMGDWLVWIKILSTGNIAFVHESLNSFRNHINGTIRKSEVITKTENRYDEIYGYSMRIQLQKELKDKVIFLNSKIKKLNDSFIKSELVSMGYFYLKNKSLLGGWKCILKSFAYKKINLSVFKHALKLSLNKH